MSRYATDLLRVVAVSFIVYNHASWNVYTNVGTGWEDPFSLVVAAINQLGKPSVLFFLFLSGLAFGAHPQFGGDSAAPFSTRSFYWNRALRIAPPYLLASLIGFFLGQSRHGFFSGLLDGANMYHLYFVALLLYLYALYPLLRRISFRPWKAALFAAPILLIHPLTAFADLGRHPLLSVTPQELHSAFGEWSGMLHASGGGALATWLIYFAYALPFFQFGIWTGQAGENRQSDSEDRRRRFQISSMLWLAAFCVVFFDFYTGVHAGEHPDPAGRVWRICVAIYALVLIEWMRSLPQQASHPLLKRLSRSSFLVYLFHPFIILALQDLEYKIQIPLVLGLSWGAGLALNWLASLHPLSGALFGEGDRQLAPASTMSPAIRKIGG
ncbi:MAG: acyltransferase [Leptospirales bacterium]|nr:acyltransferase [Leptospirales bacterium]